MTDVLPILGERSLQTATTADLGPAALGGAIASSADSLPDEPDPELSRLKTELRMAEAVQAAVHIYEQPHGQSIRVQPERVDLHLTPAD